MVQLLNQYCKRVVNVYDFLFRICIFVRISDDYNIKVNFAGFLSLNHS